MLWRTAGLAGAIVTCIAAAPATAAAAAVTVQVDPENDNFAGIVYLAAPGELNRLSVTEIDDRTLRVIDLGAVITAAGGCQSISTHTARCSTAAIPGQPSLILADVTAGDMDDEVRTLGPGLHANGGPGDDRLEGTSRVAGELNGGGGRDTLIGGRNDDMLVDGDVSGAADADLLRGRGGNDTAGYAARTAPVRVDLADQDPDGEAGEGDVLRSIERVEGGAGADDLRGGPGFNTLDGHAGADRVFGRGGEDFVDGGSGPDDLRGGPGRDFLTAGRGADRLRGGAGFDIFSVARGGPDRVSCGRARGDTVIDPSRRDFLRSDCEDAVFNYGTRQVDVQAFPRRRDAASATFDLHCPSDELLDGETIAIAGRMRLRGAAANRLLGRATIPKGPGRRCGSDVGTPRRVRVRIALNERGRQLASRPGGVLAVVLLDGFHLPHARWTIRL